jgi:hypothetical protein
MKQSNEPRPIEVAIHSADGNSIDAAVIITRNTVAFTGADRDQWERVPAPHGMGISQLKAAFAAIIGAANVAVL